MLFDALLQKRTKIPTIFILTQFLPTRNLISIFLLSSCWCLLIASCTDKDKGDKDHLVFRYNEHSNIFTLDPAFARTQGDTWAVNQLFNGLVQLDDSLHVRPDIAKRWTISDDAKQYTFTLRDDVYFHKSVVFGKDSTRNVTAKDLEYSFERLLDPKVASSGKWALNNVAHFSAENDSTFVIQLKEPFPAFLGLLAIKYCSVVPEEAVTYYGNDFRRNPVGTGPFRFKLWEENVKLVLRKNHAYHEKDLQGNSLPYLEAVAVTFLSEKQSAFLQFVQGNIDFLSGLDPSYKDELLTVAGSLKPNYEDRVKMIMGPYLNTEYLGFYLDSDTPEIQSLLLRKALNHSFDRHAMIKYLRNGIGTPAVNGFIPSGLPSFSAIEGYDHDPQLARQLIAQYKEENNTSNVPSITITTQSDYLDISEYIQREAQKVGLGVNVEVIPAATLRQGKATGKLDCFRASWVADYPDAENYLSLFYSENFAPNGPNYMHYKNTTFDSLYRLARKQVDNETRYRLYRKMDSLVVNDAPVIPLYYDEAVRFSQKNVKGLGINPINMLSLKKVKKVANH